MGICNYTMLLMVGCSLSLFSSSTALLCLHNTNSTEDSGWYIQECDTTENEISCLTQYRMHNGELLPSYLGCHATQLPCNRSCNATEGQNGDFSCCCSSDLCNMDPLRNSSLLNDFIPCDESADCNHSCIHQHGINECHVQCYCDHGYILSTDGKSCVDLDECAHGNGGCEGTCHNEMGTGYYCSCPPNQLLEDRFYCKDFTGLVCYDQMCTAESKCSPRRLQACVPSYPGQPVHCQATYKGNEVDGYDVRLLSCFKGMFSCEKGGCTLGQIGGGSIYYCCCDGQLCNGNISFP